MKLPTSSIANVTKALDAIVKLGAASASTPSTSTMNEAQTDYLEFIQHELQIIEMNSQEFTGLDVTEILAEYEGNDAELASIIEDEFDRKEQACKNILQISPPTSFIPAHNELLIATNLYIDMITIQRSLLVLDTDEELSEETVSDILQLAEKSSIEIGQHLDRYFDLINRATENSTSMNTCGCMIWGMIACFAASALLILTATICGA